MAVGGKNNRVSINSTELKISPTLNHLDEMGTGNVRLILYGLIYISTISKKPTTSGNSPNSKNNEYNESGTIRGQIVTLST